MYARSEIDSDRKERGSDRRYCSKSIILHPAKILMKRWQSSKKKKKMVISIMIEFSDFSGTHVLMRNSFSNKNIRV